MESTAASATAVMSHPDGWTPPTVAFLATVFDHLGELGEQTGFDTGDAGSPRLVTTSRSGRTYSLTLPGRHGPYEIWANTEMSVDDPLDRWITLHDREEVLAQAMHTSRLAWHRSGTSGWIGLPVALAASSSELDDALAADVAHMFGLFVSTVERVSRALEDRRALRSTRLRRGPPDALGRRAHQPQVPVATPLPGQWAASQSSRPEVRE